MKNWIKNYILPHHGNNHHPHFWNKESIALIIIVVILIQFVLISNSFLIVSKDRYLASVIPTVLISYTNEKRLENNLPRLKENVQLTQAAQLKANDMVKRGYFSHNTPEGLLPWHWLKLSGYTYDQAGENLAVNFNDSKDVVEAWMNSPTHKANIVKPIYTEIGIAMAEGYHRGKPAIFVVQFFGLPKKETTLPANISSVVTKSQITKTTSNSYPLNNSLTKFSISSVSSSTVSASSSIVSTTTSTSSQAAGIPAVAGVTSEYNPSFLEELVSSPRNSGVIALSIVLSLVMSALLVIIVVNGKFHHPRILMSGLALIVFICLLLAWNTGLFNTNSVLDDLNATSSTVHTN